jgi:hypothetical protein
LEVLKTIYLRVLEGEFFEHPHNGRTSVFLSKILR